jgi:hypothetical protein
MSEEMPKDILSQMMEQWDFDRKRGLLPESVYRAVLKTLGAKQ